MLREDLDYDLLISNTTEYMFKKGKHPLLVFAYCKAVIGKAFKFKIVDNKLEGLFAFKDDRDLYLFTKTSLLDSCESYIVIKRPEFYIEHCWLLPHR